MKHIYIATSPINGKGIRSGENIKRGEVIQPIKGKMKFMTIKCKNDSLSNPNWIGVAKNQWIDPGKPFKFLNHSCNPNAGVRGKINIVAIKDIKEGEEITLDYSIVEGDSSWEMKCECGAPNCRSIIRSIQFLPKENYHEYMPFIPTYFKKVYEKHISLKDNKQNKYGTGQI